MEENTKKKQSSLKRIGNFIKEARLSREQSVEELASDLKIGSHQLKAIELLQLCEPALQDWRDPVVISCIRLLQRRDDTLISNRLANLVQAGSDLAAEAALRALGCMATTQSKLALKLLSTELSDQERRTHALRQLKQQY